MKTTAFDTLIGLIITQVVGLHDGSDHVTIKTLCGREFHMYHEQDCCESVSILDICGDPADICNSEILMAEESTNSEDPPMEGSDESYLWTFYKLSTIKGSITIRWYGESNGYYSEEVSFCEVSK